MSKPIPLGDYIHSALSAVGITPERVETFLGQPCGCRERRQRLNDLGGWAWKVLRGKTKTPLEDFDRIVGTEKAPDAPAAPPPPESPTP